MRFADDQGMVADTNDGLQELMNGLQEEADRYGMRVNVKRQRPWQFQKKDQRRW